LEKIDCFLVIERHLVVIGLDVVFGGITLDLEESAVISLKASLKDIIFEGDLSCIIAF
jgi:intracellular septation protein A